MSQFLLYFFVALMCKGRAHGGDDKTPGGGSNVADPHRDHVSYAASVVLV